MATIGECIAKALKESAITQDEADTLSKRYEELEELERAGDMRGTTARRALTDELLRQREAQRLYDLQRVQAQDQVRKDLLGYMMRGGRGGYAGGMIRMFEGFGDAGYQSVKSIRAALLAQAHTTMADVIHTFRRSTLTMKRQNRPLMSEMAKAAFGEQASPEAKALYDAFANAADQLRIRFNDAGGRIKWRRDWGFPQEHNAGAIAKAGKDAWIDFISPRLDWGNMTDVFSGLPVRPSERPGFLGDVYDNIVSEGRIKQDYTLSQGAAALAKQRADPRFLKFKDSQSWTDYNTSFGSGSVYASMMNHISGMARDVSLLQRFGPNPTQTVEWMKSLLREQGDRHALGMPSMLEVGLNNSTGVDTRTAATNQVGKESNNLDALYSMASGQRVPDNLLATTMSGVRDYEYGTKLGSAVITHLFSGLPLQMLARFAHGVPILNTITDTLKGLGTHKEMMQAGMIAEDAMHSMERGAREQAALGRVRELTQWMPAFTTHYTGLEAVMNANRRAFASSMMTTFADNLGKTFDELPDRLRETMQGYGIQPQDWEAMRLATPGDANMSMLRAKDIERVGLDRAGDISRLLGTGSPAKAASDLSLKYLGMLHSAMESAVPVSNWRGKSLLTAGTKPGTLMGEVNRSVMMFKSGSLATMVLTQWERMQTEWARGRVNGAAYGGALVGGLLLAGMATLQTKQIVNGKDPLPMDPTTQQGAATWAHALLSSGAAGIMGDFILSSVSGFGNDALSTVAGPVATAATDILGAATHGAVRVYKGLTGQSKTDIAGDAEAAAIKLLRSNTFFLSTAWMFRAAFSRVLLDQLQYAVDPNAHQRMRQMESKVRRETGQQYFWRPGETAPDRAPELTTASR